MRPLISQMSFASRNAALRSAAARMAAAVLVVLSSAQASADGASETDLSLYTEAFPPYSMTVDGANHAAAAENITGFPFGPANNIVGA